MKKTFIELFRINLVLILCLSLLAGCGNQDAGQSGISQAGGSQVSGQPGSQVGASASGKEEQSTAASGTSGSVTLPGSSTMSGSSNVPDEKTKQTMQVLSKQFYQDKVVEIKCLKNTNGKVVESQDIYICDENDNYELAIQGAPAEYTGKWYYTEDGFGLAIWGNKLVRIDPDGTEAFIKVIENGVTDICQLSDGRIMMIMKDTSDNYKIAELEPDSGEFTKLEKAVMSKDRRQYIAAGEDGLILLNNTGFWNVNLETGELTEAASWDNYEYSLGYLVQDFKLYGSGIVDVLLESKTDELLPKNLSENRIILVMRDFNQNSALTEYVDEFNKKNSTYYIDRQFCVDVSKAADYYADTENGLITGEGADIVLTNAVGSVWDFMQRGLLEDLAPHMESTDIYEEEFFPGTFKYRDGAKIYGIDYSADASSMLISKAVLGDNSEPDIETLVDALLDYTGDEVFCARWKAPYLLNYFLKGSEDLWGMIDWEMKTCDFDTVLFAKMLEAAKLYGDVGEEDAEFLAETRGISFYGYYSQELLEQKNMVRVGYIFDDGCYATNDIFAVMIGSHSENKEGAWEFLRFLLSDEVQTSLSYHQAPVSRAAYEEAAAREISEGAYAVTKRDDGIRYQYKAGYDEFLELKKDGDEYNRLYGLTQEKADEIEAQLENVALLPIRTSDILDIIWNESSAYFDGTIPADEACRNIQTKVQQYLDENLN